MKAYYKKLLDLTFELEGLLLLGLNKEEMPDSLKEAIQKKLEQLCEEKEVKLPAEKAKNNEENKLVEKSVSNEGNQEIPYYVAGRAEIPEDDFMPFYSLEDDEASEPQIKQKPQPRKNHGKKLPVFSLNDRFLFIRELFDGDAGTFNTVLNRIASMESFAEAERYLTENYCRNRKESETEDRFLNVIEDYFNS